MSRDKEQTAVSVIRGQHPVVHDNTIDFSTQQIAVFQEIAKGAGTGVKTPGDAILLYLKAKELGIGFGSAIPHMHVVNGKSGIDIHIVKALLSRPGSGVHWKKVRDYQPLYVYIDAAGNKYYENVTLPTNIVIVPIKKLTSVQVEDGKFAVSILPEDIKTGKVKPYDYITEYVFTRQKYDFNNEVFETTEVGKFTWQQAITAQLPLDKAGNFSEDSAWGKYRPLMIDIRAFTNGARAIASDILMGCYERSELYDMEHIPYKVEHTSDEPVIVELKEEE